nr:flagellar export protein FliJ [Spongiibacter thalassae]
MKPVNALAERREKERARHFATMNTAHEVLESKLRDLEQYYEDYRNADAGHRQVDIQRLTETRQFLSTLSQAISLQREAVAASEKKLAAEREKWMAARRHSQNLENLSEKYRDQERQSALYAEQRSQDEMNSQRFVWRKMRQNNMA